MWKWYQYVDKSWTAWLFGRFAYFCIGSSYPELFLPLRSHEALFGFFARGLSFESSSNLGLLSVNIRHLAAKKDLCCEANNHFFKSIDKSYQSLYWTRAQAHNQMFIHLLVLSHTGGKTWAKGASSLPPGWCSPLTLLSASSPALRQDWPGGSGWKIAQAGSAKWPRGSAA